MLTAEKVIVTIAKAKSLDVMINEWSSREKFGPLDDVGWSAYKDATSDISHLSIGSRNVYFYTEGDNSVQFLVIDEDGDLIQHFVFREWTS